MNIFQRGQRSLFGEILDWMLTPLLLLVPVSIGVTWLVAQGIANAPFDRALEYNVQTLATLVTVQGQQVRFYLPQPSRDILRADDSDRVYYQVRTAEGDVLGGDADLPLPPEDEPPTDERVFMRDERMRNELVRVAYTWVQPALPGSGLVLVQVAETRTKQKVLATEIIKGVLLPQFAILPLAILLIWLALVRGIKPLSVLEDRIRERNPDDLSPLDDSGVPVEVAPLVMSVNGLLTRLQDSIATQKRFLADAAHQLKTPLAGLRMQADLAQREGANADELKQSLKQIGRASVRATHTVNQLLALARAEGTGASISRQPCDLARLTIEVVREAVPRAIEKHIDIGYDGLEAGAKGVMLQGNLTLLKELVRNLVDNALNYTPSTADRPGVITARVLADPFGRVLMLQVEDNGPGIAMHERALVFEPFYRVLGNEADGSGLGLPIVREIANQHGARVTLDDAHPGKQPPGTCFSVRFDTGA
ncbi:MAG: sensor histidine kinase [Variovorax sp.]|nr:MAG: sensor histidine kinase [Variovorax sp.]